ncbi:MAG: GGDEF domain-containing response regulator [Burkholderiales bacterium]
MSRAAKTSAIEVPHDPLARRILVVDDDLIMRRTLETVLRRRGFDVVTADAGEQAYKILQQDDAPRVAIVDWMMPGMDGVELCRKLRDSASSRYTYILMLTGRRESQDVIDGLHAGADDYMRKPFNVDELHARVQTAQRLVTVHEQLRRKAEIDELTGLLSRSAVLELLRRGLALASREGTPLSVILGDVDHFKEVNDRHGHAFGDVVLRDVAKRLYTRLRPYDAVGRYGGEEFLLVLPGCAAVHAFGVAERVRASIADTSVSSPSGPVPVTISLGVATSTGRETSPDALIDAADKALYQAKTAGRNRTVSSA